MFPVLTTTGSTSVDLSSIFELVTSFLMGFLGCIVDVINYIISDPWLALVIIVIPLAMLIFNWAKKTAKIKSQ